MLAKTFLAALGLMSLATAFHVPAGTTDGFYRAYYDEAGNEVHELVPAGALQPSNNPPVAPSFPIAKLGRRGTAWCGCGFGMDHGDCDAANSDLQSQLSSGGVIGPHLAYYSIRGSAVSFMCNRDSFSAQVFSGSAVTGAQHVTSACGWYIAGTWRVDGFTNLDFGYMNYNSGLDFCGNAEGSGSHHC